MQIRPILAALRRHKLATFLIAMEIALACAVLCNACSMISHRLSAMNINSGVDEASLGEIVVTGFDPALTNDLNARMLAGLRAIPGVESVHVVNSVPFGPQGFVAGTTFDQAGKHDAVVTDFYLGGPGTPKALGLKLIAGHFPAAADYQPVPAKNYFPKSSRIVITQALATKLWPGENPLGKQLWGGPYQFRVMGVVASLAVSQYTQYGARGAEWCAFVPVQPGGPLAGTYLIRANPAVLNRVMVEARAAVRKIAPDAVLDYHSSHTVSFLRERFFKTDRAMTGLLVGVIVALLGVTALGIVGLASFWVAQRRKQIGIRRAVGATCGDILRYFLTENFLVVSFGVVLGMAAALLINLMLMKLFEVDRMPLYYLPIGAVALWLLGQLAVLGPALRAARVPPVVATRSV
ncbi:ABC transporter permease [Dyella sp. A6]|uniref:ABC transporter permease n=1 Tax=Dyella aluminiiresistens TaxID=3069105 RepID=UPI002E7A62AE|nr:FtsX-like permease family protein [Dyella sp. A6]